MTERSLVPIQRRARAGDPEAQYLLGKGYLEGSYGLPQSERAGFLWLEKAARQGHNDAIRLIGEAVAVSAVGDLDAAAPLYESAAAMGCLRAQRVVANRLLTNPDGDYQVAWQKLVRAADGGDREAQLRLAWLYDSGEGVPRDRECANHWYEKAAAQGSLAAQHQLAQFHWDREDPAAIRWLAPLAKQGDVEASYRFGVLLGSLGRSREAAAWLRRTADAGHAQAQFALGMLFTARGGVKANGVPHSYKKAAYWLEKATRHRKQALTQAFFELYRLYGSKTSSCRDPALARQCLEQAAEKGHTHAQYLLGCAVDRRSGVPGADVSAAQWLSRAAARGHREAKALLELRCPPPPQRADEVRARHEQAIRLLARCNLAVATRFELAVEFDLMWHEALMIVPASADRGECLVLDFRDQVRGSRRRIVLVQHGRQRDLLDRSHRILTGDPPFPGDLRGSFDHRRRSFERICQGCGVKLDWRQRLCRASETGLGFAKDKFGVIQLADQA
ncbi:MAG: SEL1-like repeat protein [Betaproteobacteria bacterium]|nr:SEL1-like repeat protein [Betaproteobacteria bacterium]